MNILEILKQYGPMLSSDLKQHLIETGISDETARQRISREGKSLKRLSGLIFPKRAVFLYLEDQEKTDAYFDNLLEALKKSNSAHFYALHALSEMGGIVSFNKFKVLSSVPEKRKKQKCFNQLLSELLKTNLIYKKQNEKEELIELNSAIVFERLDKTSKNTLNTIEELMFTALSCWIKKNCLGSYGKIKRFSDFNSYTWDLTVPSYFFPIGNQNKPGFLVADIYPQYNISKDLVACFSKKFEASRSQYKNGNFLPILLGNGFLPDAFEFGKKNGFIITTPANLFGDEIGALLLELKNTLENMASSARNKSEDDISKLITSVAKLEGKSNNIRGDLFNLVTAFIISKIYSSYIQIGKNIQTSDGKKAEVDVYNLIGDKEANFIECKGYNSNQTISKENIERWLSRIVIIRDWLLHNDELKSKKHSFEYWATCSYSSEAIELLEQLKQTKKYFVSYKTKADILQLVRDNKLNSIYKVISEHYGD